MRLGQKYVLVEGVARLADGTYHVVLLFGCLAVEVDDTVVRSIEGGADEVGEASIDDDELLHGGLLHIVDFGDKRTALSNDCPSQLEVYGLSRTHFEMLLIDREIVFKFGDGIALRVFVVDAETTTYVNDFQLNALCLQTVLQFVDAMGKGDEVVHL